MRIAVKKRIPLIGRSPLDSTLNDPNSLISSALRGTLTRADNRRLIESVNLQTRSVAIRKPGRRLGGGWLDEFVSAKKAVNLCATCAKRYGDWWSKRNYRIRDRRALTDCDGCGNELELCNSYFYGLYEIQ